MPSISFQLSIDQYDTKYSYNIEPADFEMYPKVNSQTRVEACALGLWNKDAVLNYETTDVVDSEANAFAIGQNFIRKYNMTIQFVERASSNDISMAVYLGNAQ